MSDTEVDVTERLFAEFTGVHPLTTITAAVRQAHLDLQGAPRGAMPELVERLARQRLSPPAPTSQDTEGRQ
jgi:hypothetical protein